MHLRHLKTFFKRLGRWEVALSLSLFQTRTPSSWAKIHVHIRQTRLDYALLGKCWEIQCFSLKVRRQLDICLLTPLETNSVEFSSISRWGELGLEGTFRGLSQLITNYRSFDATIMGAQTGDAADVAPHAARDKEILVYVLLFQMFCVFTITISIFINLLVWNILL